jgi:acyl-CoA synthetase (NDP forming)
VVVLTTAGGWGVVTADALTRDRPRSSTLPDDLLAAIDEKLPPAGAATTRSTCAGGETRTRSRGDGLVAEHPEVDAVVYLGLGIQSNQAG